jgi:hypothetical protein
MTECEDCGRSFTRADSLKRHILTKHGPATTSGIDSPHIFSDEEKADLTRGGGRELKHDYTPRKLKVNLKRPEEEPVTEVLGQVEERTEEKRSKSTPKAAHQEAEDGSWWENAWD